LVGEIALPRIVPTADDKSRDITLLGGELQSAGGGQGKPDDLAHDGGERRMQQAFLQRRQDFPVAAGLAVDDAVRMQSDAR
jgi:hypothetical protein